MKILIAAALLCVSLFANSLDEIRKSGVIRIGVYNNQPPFSSLTDGKFVGFEAQLAGKIAKDIFGDNPGKTKFIHIATDRRMNVLEKNEVDIVVATFTPTPKRARRVDFSDPYFKVQVGILSRVDDNITSLSQLHRRKIFVIKNSPIHNFLAKEGFRKNLKFCTSSAKCYRAFKKAKNAVHADDNLILRAYAIIDNKTKVALDGLGNQTFNAIAVQKGNKELLDFINSDLAQLKKDGFLDKFFDDTLAIHYRGTVDKKEFLLD